MNIIFIIEAASSPSEIFKKRFKKEKRSESSIWEVQLSLFSRYFQHLPSFNPHYTQISPHQPQFKLCFQPFSGTISLFVLCFRERDSQIGSIVFNEDEKTSFYAEFESRPNPKP